MRKPITIRRFRMDGKATCEECQTVKEWTRERARQHAADHHHTVRFVIEDITVYRPTESNHG